MPSIAISWDCEYLGRHQMKDLFPVRRPHTAGTESINDAVKLSRELVQVLKAREARRGPAPPLQRKDNSVTPALFASVELPKPPERPPPPSSLIDDSAQVWANLMAKHTITQTEQVGLGSLKHEYKEMYLLLLANRSTKRINGVMKEHASQAPMPSYDWSGDGTIADEAKPFIFSNHQNRSYTRPLSAFSNSYGMSSEHISPPSVAPLPVLDMGMRLAEKDSSLEESDDDSHGNRSAVARRPNGSRLQQARRITESALVKSAERSSTAFAGVAMQMMAVAETTDHAHELTKTGADANEHGTGATASHGTPLSVRPSTAPPSSNRAGLGRGAVLASSSTITVISDEQLKPVAERLNIDMCRIQEQLLRGEKLSAALHKSLQSLRKSYESPPEQPGQDKIASILKKHSAASAEKRRVQSKRAAVAVDAGRFKVGQTKLSAEKTAEIHSLQDLNPGLATAAVAIIRNTQVQGGRVRRASVQFHDSADVRDAAASNAVERRQHEQFLERPHRVSYISALAAVCTSKF